MLFTLLPLVGWAYDNVTFTVHIGDNDVELSGQGEAVTAYLTYDATDKALPFPTKIGEEEIHQGQGQGTYLVSYTWFKATGSGNDAVKTGAAIDKITDAGTYVCEFVINKANENYNHSAILTFNKCMLDVTATDLTGNNALHYGDAFTAANVNWSFDGWPAAIDTEAKQNELKESFGNIEIITNYVPFESGVTSGTDYYQIIPVITGLNSNNYDFTAHNGSLEIKAKDMAALTSDFAVTVSNIFYTAASAAPTVSVVDNANPDKTVAANQYELIYYSDDEGTHVLDAAPKHVDTYYVRIKGTANSNYTGTYPEVFSYKIRPEMLQFTLKNPQVNYKGAAYDLSDKTNDLKAVGFIEKVLGLTGEAGETADKIKKILRDKDGVVSGEDRDLIAKELGDTLWYIAAIARYLDLSLSEIAKGNIDKLENRYQRNKIHGEGDKR